MFTAQIKTLYTHNTKMQRRDKIKQSRPKVETACDCAQCLGNGNLSIRTATLVLLSQFRKYNKPYMKYLLRHCRKIIGIKNFERNLQVHTQHVNLENYFSSKVHLLQNIQQFSFPCFSFHEKVSLFLF
jgi:hypothetical protein